MAPTPLRCLLIVSDLIAKLQTLPPEALVLVRDGEFGEAEAAMAETIFASRTESHEHWHGPYVTDDEHDRLIERARPFGGSEPFLAVVVSGT